MQESPLDLEYMLELTEKMADTQQELSVTKHALEVFKAQITQTVTEDESYWVGGKVPSMAYITSHYHLLGYNSNTGKGLTELENKIAQLEADLLRYRTKFQIEKDRLEVWRTESANTRSTLNLSFE